MNRTIYHIIETANGWKIQMEGSETILAKNENKEELIKEAIEIARTNEPSQIVIHKKDGNIDERINYDLSNGDFNDADN